MRKQKITFYDWCVNNNRQIYLDNWDYKANVGSPKDYSYGSAVRISFKCPRGLHQNTIKPLNNISNSARNCKENYCLECNSFKQWCIDHNKTNLLDLWDYELNKVSPNSVGCNSNISFYFKCQKGIHKSHKHVLSAIVKQNNKVVCQECNSIGQFGVDHIEDFIHKYWSVKNCCSPYDICIGSKKKIILNCQVCSEEYTVRADHFVNGVRHKGCSLLNGKSKLQFKVEKYISDKYDNFTLLHENHCTIIPKSPITNYNMYFDNEIKELKLLIEVHGEQHYKSCSWDKYKADKDNVTQESVFKQRQLYDKYKKNFALNSGYFYLEIPYWTERDESYKNLIDDKIREIYGG